MLHHRLSGIRVGRRIGVSVEIYYYNYIHKYHSRFIPEEVAQASQILLRDAHVLPKLLSYEEYCRRASGAMWAKLNVQDFLFI
jgi:hypothetical protein